MGRSFKGVPPRRSPVVAGGPASFPVTLMGRPVGDRRAMHTTLTPDEVQPRCSTASFRKRRSMRRRPRGRAGLHEMGLPYVNDPAVTRHLRSFCNGTSAMRTVPRPTRFCLTAACWPAVLQRRLIDGCEVVRHSGRPWKPLVLTNPSLDLAVAWGAVAFNWLGRWPPIGGGIPRSYYIHLSPRLPGKTTPGKPGLSVLCVPSGFGRRSASI